MSKPSRAVLSAAVAAALPLTLPPTAAAEPQMSTTAPAVEAPAVEAPAEVAEVSPDELTLPPIDYTLETLDNGLTVIYAPMDNAPVVHVRVLYHVGSRDEQPDRQGFAHMFEHMMFRGSANVESEEHMNLINATGGNSNAFTSFDQTTYINTVPSNHLEMALYLEADRMASFVVSPEVFETERDVVAEEWRLRTANPPYGTLFQDFFDLAFEQHHYKWTPIGDMDQLAASTPEELNAFHDKYYNPNNATLIIGGQFDVDQARQWVRDYFGWIEAGPEVERPTPPPAEQTQMRKRVVHKDNIPLPRVIMGWKTTDYADEDQVALGILGSIVGDGRSSRMYQALVGSGDPVANVAQAGNDQLEDIGLFIAIVGVLPGKDPDAAEQAAIDVIREIQQNGVTQEELDKAKTQFKLSLINGRTTGTAVATALGEAHVFGGDAEFVNKVGGLVDALSVEDVKRVANEYLVDDRLTIVQYRPGPGEDYDSRDDAGGEGAMLGLDADTQPVSLDDHDQGAATKPASDVVFPDGYPTEPPFNTEAVKADFEKGTTFDVQGVEVIVLPDDRLPTVTMNLVLPTGGHAAPAEKAGVASLTASMLSRGAGGLSAEQLATALDSRGISASVGDGGDTTRVSLRTTVDQVPEALRLVRLMLLEPAFDEAEFQKLKNQATSGLQQQLVNPGAVAGRELATALYGDSPLGTQTTRESLAGITLDDVKAWYESAYKPAEGAFAVFAGDVTEEQAREYATYLLDGWDAGDVPEPTYDLPEAAGERRIILVDNPGGQQATIRIAGRTYDNQSDDKYAGSVASQILSNGIDSRMNRLLRAEKGLTYGAYAVFRPGRQDGQFTVTVDTKPETAQEAIKSAFEVLDTMRNAPVEQSELETAQQIVAGSMVMSTQTIDQQAGRRVTIETNGYPVDYYDTLPQRVNEVTLDDVQQVMQQYVTPDTMTIVVVGPADQIKPQLEALGTVEVVPMPLAR